jgi:hypothetical protein
MARTRFTQADLRRALRAAKAEGFEVKIEISPEGTITITPLGKVVTAASSLDEWMAKRAHKIEGR